MPYEHLNENVDISERKENSTDIYGTGEKSNYPEKNTDEHQRNIPHPSLSKNDVEFTNFAENEFISIITFDILSKISGLPAEFHRDLLNITTENDTLVRKLARADQLLLSVQPRTSGELRKYLDGYQQLVQISLLLQLPVQTDGNISVLFSKFLKTVSRLFELDIVRNSLPESIVNNVMKISEHSRVITEMYHDFNTGELSSDHVIARLLDSGLLPESFHASLGLMDKLIKLYQNHPLTSINVRAFSEWLVAVFQDDEAALLLNDVIPKGLQSILVQVISGAQQAEMMWKNEASLSDWLTWLWQQALSIVPEQERSLVINGMVSPDAPLYRLIQMTEMIYTISLHHPLSEQQSSTSWLMDVLMDEQTHPALGTFLPTQMSDILATSTTLFKAVNRYPLESSVWQQLSWVAEEYRSPSPELQRLLTLLPTDTFIHQLRESISHHAIDPEVLDLLLTLVDPSISLKQKSGLLFRQLTGAVNLEQLIAALVKNYVPGGGLMFGIWEWYQDQSEKMTWAYAMNHLSASLAQHWPEEAAFADKLLTGTWQEVGEKAAELITKCSPEVSWVYLRYLELSMLWSGRELLMISGQTGSEVALTNLSESVHRYFAVLGLPFPDWLSRLPVELGLLLSLRDEINSLPRDESWISWLSGLLETLERYPRAAKLRHKIEMGVRETVIDMVGVNMNDAALEIVNMMTSKLYKPLDKYQHQVGINVSLSEKETEKTSSSGEWRHPQVRQSHHQTRGQQRRRKLRQRHLLQRKKKKMINRKVKIKHPTVERNERRRERLISPRVIRNVALSVAGIYLFSRFSAADAAPAGNEEIWRNTRTGEEEITEIDGKDYILFPSAFDEDEYWRIVWSRLSTLSLSVAFMSVPGIILYRFLQRKKSARPLGSEYGNAFEMSVIAGEVASNESDNNDLGSSSSLLENTDTEERSEARSNIFEQRTPEIIAMLTLLAGVGGYVYGREREEYHDKREGELIDNAPETRPVIKVTPSLLEKFNNSQDIVKSVGLTVEEVFLLTGGSEETVGGKLRRKREAIDYVSDSLKVEIKTKWKDSDGFYLSVDNIKETVFLDGVFYFHQIPLIKIDDTFWEFKPEKSNPLRGMVRNNVSRKEIKIFKNKDGKWEMYYDASIITDGERLINKMLTFNDYSDETRLIFDQQIVLILKGRSYIEFETFKKYLIEDLVLIFFKNSNDIQVGIEILQAINEIQNADESENDPSQTLMNMTARESAVSDIYYNLLETRISHDFSYNNAIAEYFGGQGERQEVINMLNNGSDVLKGMINTVNSMVENRIKDCNSDINWLRSKLKHSPTNDYNLVRLNVEVNDKIKEIKSVRNELPRKKKKIIQFLKNISNNIEESTREFSEINRVVMSSENQYLSGIKLADSYIKSLPLNFKEYNRAMFNIIKEEYRESLASDSDIHYVEKYRAAKVHVNSVYSASIMLRNMLSILPEDLFSVTLRSRFSIQRYNDYRDIILVEEVAAECYSKNKITFDTIFSNAENDDELLEIESVISAILFYMLRKKEGKHDVEKQGIKKVIEFYFKCKFDEHPFKSLSGFPTGYYTLKDFKKRNNFNSQYAYNEQFNFYKEHYMPHDAEFHTSYLFKKANVPLFMLISKISSLEEYYYDTSTATVVTDVSASNEIGKVSAIGMTGGGWLLLISLDGSIDVKYFISKKEAEDSFFGFFIQPEKYFGKRTTTLSTLEVTTTGMLYDVYPTDSLTGRDLLDYEFKWKNLGYMKNGAPIFHRKKNLITKDWREKTALDYSSYFTYDCYSEIVEKSKVSLDETGFWHHLATSVIPFYDVIYKCVNDRYYTISISDGMSIVTDILSVMGFLINIGMKASEISERIVLAVTQKYNNLIMSGVSRNAALITILRDFPTAIMKASSVLSFLKILRREIISLLNPLPFDLGDVSSSVYKFAAKKSNVVITGIKETLDKIPTKIKTEWRVKDQKTISLIENDSSKKDMIFTLNKSVDNELDREFIKYGNDYYSVSSDGQKNNWYITKPDVSGDGSTRMHQAVYKNGDEWSSLPSNEGRLEHQPYRGFESTKIPIGFASEFIINHSRTFKRTMSFSAELNDYKVDRNFTVVPVGPAVGAKEIYLHKDTAILALTNATHKVRELKRKWRELDRDKKSKATVTSMNNVKFSGDILQKHITSLNENDINTKFFALVKKTENWQTDPNSVYGMATLHYDLENSILYFKSLSAHPYTIAAKDVVLSSFLTPEDANKYKVKNIAAHLGASSIRQALDYHNILPGNRRLKYFATYTANPVTEAMVRSLQGIHHYIEAPFDNIKQRVRSTVDNLSSFFSGSILRDQAVQDPATLQQLYNEAASRMLSSLPGSELSQNRVAGMVNLDEFHPIKKEVYPDPEIFKDYKEAGFKNYNFNEVVDDINNLDSIQLTKYGTYANLIKSSANELITTLENVIDIITQSKSNPELKGKVNDYFTEAFKLNYEAKDQSMASSLSNDEILKKISERFEYIVTRCHNYLLEQKNKGYTNFSIVDAIPNSQRGTRNLNAIYAFTLHLDANKKIYLTLNGENYKSDNLKYNIAHEATHLSSGTKDHSYFDNVRIFESKNISDINVASSHYFSDHPEFENKSANFIFNYEKTSNLPEVTRKKAMKYIENNNLVRSDLLLHTAEFDAMLIKEFEEKFCQHGRSRRETVSPSLQQPDMKNIIQTILFGILLN